MSRNSLAAQREASIILGNISSFEADLRTLKRELQRVCRRNRQRNNSDLNELITLIERVKTVLNFCRSRTIRQFNEHLHQHARTPTVPPSRSYSDSS
jgi:hypothetical protein